MRKANYIRKMNKQKNDLSVKKQFNGYSKIMALVARGIQVTSA